MAALPPTPKLTGDLWEPKRSPSRVVEVSEFEKLPLHRWLRVSGNKLDDVVPRPRYPTFVGNDDGSPNIDVAWSGAAWGYIQQRMYLSGGGHADTLYFDGPSPVELNYKNCEMDGWTLLHMRNGNQYRRWDLRPKTRSKTRYSNNSRGAYLGAVEAGVDLVYGHKLLVRMPQRRENVVLSGSANALFRYGRALDSGAPGPWGAFHERITLESADGSHRVFNDPAQWLLQTPAAPLFAAGGTYDHAGQCIWVQTNLAAGALYKITCLDGPRWQVDLVPGVAALTTNVNGTYQRCQLFTKGAARCLLRVSSTTGHPEVCRVA